MRLGCARPSSCRASAVTPYRATWHMATTVVAVDADADVDAAAVCSSYLQLQRAARPTVISYLSKLWSELLLRQLVETSQAALVMGRAHERAAVAVWEERLDAQPDLQQSVCSGSGSAVVVAALVIVAAVVVAALVIVAAVVVDPAVCVIYHRASPVSSPPPLLLPLLLPPPPPPPPPPTLTAFLASTAGPTPAAGDRAVSRYSRGDTWRRWVRQQDTLSMCTYMASSVG
jgi:hypothetical protein